LLSVRREAASGRPRKWYTLTEAGHRALRRAAAAWSADYARKQALVLPAVRHSAARREARHGVP
jgi:DNA-binding PadR family transcriptional regulator